MSNICLFCFHSLIDLFMFNELSYIYLTNIGYSKLFILLHSSLTMIDFFFHYFVLQFINEKDI